MKSFIIVILLLLLIPAIVEGQENFVPGQVTLTNGEILEGQINYPYWKATPTFIEFKGAKGDTTKYRPESILEFRIGENSIYKSRLVVYDSSSRSLSEKLTKEKKPNFKSKRVFLKVLVAADKNLLVWTGNGDQFYFEVDGATSQLVSHPYLSVIGDREIRMENKLYISQLTALFKDCNKFEIPYKLMYDENSFSNLFLKYASCMGREAKLFKKKEKVVIRKGFVGTLSYDRLRKGFDGGGGYGIGGFLTVYYPYRVYKYSLYNELGYRKFGNQVWQGLDYVGFPLRETHQIQSIKFTEIMRSRLSKKPGAPYAGYTYIGAGLTGSAGLTDLYQRGIYIAKNAGPFFGAIIDLGVYVDKFLSLDLRYERGSHIYYDGYVVQDNRPVKSTGYTCLQASILVEF